jgi:flagellar hook-associated protein 3 FlgL
MAISRVSDAQTFAFLTERAGRLQVQIRDLQEQIASGRRLHRPEEDPLGAGRAVVLGSSLAALGQYEESSRFGAEVLAAQDEALGQAELLLVRAEEIATQQASGLLGPAERAAAREEVHGLLDGLTVIANGELAGRRIFGGLALGAPAPFADPDAPGYSAATAFGGSTEEFWVKVGGDATDRVRLSTRGDRVFSDALTAVEALETALATGGDVAATLAGLAQGRETLAAERASVGARQSELIDRVSQVAGITFQTETALSRVRDADQVEVVTRLIEVQSALEALLAAGARVTATSLASLLRL